MPREVMKGLEAGPLARIHALRAIRTVPVQQAGGRGAPLRASDAAHG